MRNDDSCEEEDIALGWDNEILNEIYDKTDGYCRYCGKKICWKNYGEPGERGAWEVDHSNPRALGGTDRMSNLWPACIECNRDKSTMTGPQYSRFFESEEETWSLGDLIISGIGLLALSALLSQLSRNLRSD